MQEHGPSAGTSAVIHVHAAVLVLWVTLGSGPDPQACHHHVHPCAEHACVRMPSSMACVRRQILLRVVSLVSCWGQRLAVATAAS